MSKLVVGRHGRLALLGGEPIRCEPYPVHTTRIGEREKRLVAEVLDSGVLSGFAARNDPRWLGGPFVRRLEEAVCARFGSRFAVSFNSATSALHGTVMAAGVEPGDEVITTPLTMTATASSVLMHGGVPVFSDVDDVCFTLDPALVMRSASPRTKAIMTVNLCGQASELDDLKARADEIGAVLIEDNSHAYGARYRGRWTGTIGRMGVLSFNFHKLLQTGEGGVVLTDDEECAFRLRLIRNHGEALVEGFHREDLPSQLGWNYRMTELQAAVGIGQLEQLDDLIAWRVRLAARLAARLAGHPFLAPPVVKPDREMTYYVYTLKFDPVRAGLRRDTFVKAIQAEGLPLNGGYVPPLYRQPMYRTRRFFGRRGYPFLPGVSDADPEKLYADGCCPVAERLHDEVLITTWIVRYPQTERDMDQLADGIEKVTDNLDVLRRWDTDRNA
jgi:dTDP-4-amino-4,6-dideoxygalactose transaminase